MAEIAGVDGGVFTSRKKIIATGTMCSSYWGQFICTRELNHTGKHMAGITEYVYVAYWPVYAKLEEAVLARLEGILSTEDFERAMEDFE